MPNDNTTTVRYASRPGWLRRLWWACRGWVQWGSWVGSDEIHEFWILEGTRRQRVIVYLKHGNRG